MALLSEQEVKSRLADLDGWQRRGDAIERQFDLRDFVGSVEFVNRIARPAEEMNHHPDLEISWSKVTVSLSTHSQGGLTDNDFELARRVDGLA